MKPVGLMRTLLPSRLFARGHNVLQPRTRVVPQTSASATTCDPVACAQKCRCYAHIESTGKADWKVDFVSTAPQCSAAGPSGNHTPPDQRTLQLGRTVRILHERLPTLLLSPLPSETLSPQISLHLFPSTHPHLPTVSGRIAYVAALWTAPMAWGRVPLVGNVKLTILSERMVRSGNDASGSSARGDERLIVKWKTCSRRPDDHTGGIYRGAGISMKDPVDKIKDFINGMKQTSGSLESGPKTDEEFCGIFVFEFDDSGRIVKHVIEHTEEGGHYDKTTRVVSVTDWLLGHFTSRGKQQLPELVWCDERRPSKDIRAVTRARRFDH